MPGVFEENLPLVVPNRVSIIGTDIRNTVVKPAAGSESKDVFHLDDSTLISNLTIKDYQYDSSNNTGYAFRFSPNAVITNRSPYIQDITVITKGSTVSASDPRGFAAGDAGKGAWIDGAELNSATVEASMLFHSATFITPGVDAITMTNGVRVEWLNSFTYFANRGLYAVNGVTGRTSYDGSTVNYGAEVRSIGSANVYGNYGAVADGADTLMYLIQHNFGYIGAGKFVDNDDSRAIQSQEVTELNSGKINFVTTDHTGGFRIGDNFFVDFETGNTTISIDTLTVNQFNALRVTTGANTTIIDGSFIDTGNLIIASNDIQSDTGDLNLASATGTINLQDNTNITGTLDVSGDFSFGGALNIGGDQTSDSLTFNTALDQNFNPHQHQTFSLGSFAKKWLQAHLNKIETPDFDIYDNVIETKTSNADLELRAAGTGRIHITDSARFNNNVTINGSTNILDNLNISDSILPIVGDVNQTGNFTISNDAGIDQRINVGASAEFEEVLVDDNFITTTTSNTDLELRASGTGTVNLQDTVNVTNNLTAGDTTATNTNITLNATSDNANIGNLEINDNYIETIIVDGNLILSADRNVVVTGTDVNLAQDLTVQGATDLQSTTVTGLITHVGDTTQTGNAIVNGEFTNGNLYIEDNFIITTQLNADLDLRATGNVNVSNNNVTFGQNLTVQGVTDLQALDITGTLAHTGAYNQTGNYTIGGELTVDNVYVEDNFITTTSGNLTLGAAGTGTIFVSSNNVSITNNLDVDSVTNLDVTNIDGTLTHTGDRTHTGNYTIGGELTVDNVYIEDNFITTTSGNLNLGATGDINVNANNVEIAQDLTVSGTTSLQGTSVTGNITHTGAYNQTGNLDVAGEISNGNISIEDNFISTTATNSDLELRANGTGEVVIDTADTLTIQNNLTVGGTLTYQGFLTINGDVALLGNTQDGSLTVTNDFDVTGTLDISSQAQFEDIRIEDNFITTTQSNSNLELRASGTGEVLVPNNNVQVNNNLFAASISTGDINVNNDLVLDELEITDSNIEINENYIATKTSNSNLELRASASGVIDPEYNNGAIINLTGNGSDFFSREVTVNGVRIVAAGTVGSQTAVPDAFVEKVARMFELFTDVNGAGINETSQRTFIKTLSGDAGTYHAAVGPTLQRVARGAGADYTPNFLTDSGIAFYNLSPLFDSHVANDMVWYLNSTGDAPGDGDNDAQEVIEHVFHTLHMHGLDAVALKMYPYISADWATGPLYAAMEEAYDAGKWDSSGYGGNAWKTDGDAFEVAAKEYLFLLNFGMFEYSSLWDGGSLAPEWTDDMRTQSGIQTNNPLGYALHNTYIAPVISKPSLTTIRNIFQDGDVGDPTIAGPSGYVVDTGASNVTSQENTIIEQNLTVNGNTSLQGTTVTGTLTHVGGKTQTGNYVINGALTTGLITLARPLQVGDIKISGNVLETTVSNSNLDLRAVGTGQVKIETNVDIQNNLSVRNFNVDSITVSNSVDLEIIDLSTDIQFEDNTITTTNSNSNLELRAAGTGSVYLQNIEVTQSSISTRTPIDSTSSSITLAPTENLIVNSTASLQVPRGTTLQRIVAQDTFLDGGAAINSASILDGGNASTVFGASDTIYNSGGSVLTTSGNIGDIRFNTSDSVFESTGATSTISLGGVYSADRQTSITADPTSNTIRFIVNGSSNPLDSSSLVGEVTGEGLTIHGLQTDDILLDNNVISTTVSNSNLDLAANGTGKLVLDDLSFNSNIIQDNGNNLIVKHTNFGHAKISGTYGVVVPSGTTVVPSPAPQIGDTRWNTTSNLLETWDGATYVTSAGVAAAITAEEFDDLLLEFTLIFG